MRKVTHEHEVFLTDWFPRFSKMQAVAQNYGPVEPNDYKGLTWGMLNLLLLTSVFYDPTITGGYY